VKGVGKKGAETMYVRTTTKHLVTCELDGTVWENYKELKDHVGRELGMSMYIYVMLVHDRLAEEREKVAKLEKWMESKE
jgi:hypothetical protein